MHISFSGGCNSACKEKTRPVDEPVLHGSLAWRGLFFADIRIQKSGCHLYRPDAVGGWGKRPAAALSGMGVFPENGMEFPAREHGRPYLSGDHFRSLRGLYTAVCRVFQVVLRVAAGKVSVFRNLLPDLFYAAGRTWCADQ